MEQAGAKRPFRIMQKRGVFVDCEDFLPVTATYPEHPLSKVVPNHKNLQRLKEKRAADYKTDVLFKEARMEEQKRNVTIPISRIPDEGYCANPKYTSINQKIAEEKRNARTKVGLTEETE